MSREILIAGGGIGGLAAALALSRQGHAVRVLERASEFAEIDTGCSSAPMHSRHSNVWESRSVCGRQHFFLMHW
ncbi:FAD-dependent oxidoreductase [Burkholderia multivorans]|uniref:FAD-dependent oxidoreductase n=1 Tax=Burkholderia multivorans TaxID=87883 RepID=UPI001C26EDA8|nr:FAD-dependent oxidoreductase [Burkholderia multivorans]